MCLINIILLVNHFTRSDSSILGTYEKKVEELTREVRHIAVKRDREILICFCTSLLYLQ